MPITEIDGSDIFDGSLTHADVSGSNIDGLETIPSLRTLGTGSQQAVPGDDARLSDERVAHAFKTSTTIVSISGSSAPSPGDALVALSDTEATWQPVSGSGVTETQHENLDTLTHDLSEDYFLEYTYQTGCSIRVASATYYVDDTKATKIREYNFQYSGVRVSQQTTIQFDFAGSEVQRLVLDYNYNGNRIQSVSGTKTP